MEQGVKEVRKTLHAFKSKTVRELVDRANELNILKEDIVTLIIKDGFYILLYYS